MEDQRERITESLLLELFVKKLMAQGIEPSERLKARFREWTKTNPKGTFRFRDPRGKNATAAPIEFTASDARSLAAKLERRLARAMEKGVLAAVKTAPKFLRSQYERTWPAQSRHLDRIIRGFNRRLYQRYEAGFELLAMQLLLSRELGEEINRSARAQQPTGGTSQLIDALTRLHGRACQIGHEIAVLLRAGYADGAMARWRTLHEVSVMFQFIAQCGEETATRYLAHDAIESRKAAHGYNAMAARLRHKPFTASELTQIDQAADAALAKYGPDFASDYGWAAVALSIKKPNFAEIERAVKLDHLRPYYKFASHNVHANPKGILYRMGVMNDRSLLPTGPTNLGLTGPAQNTAISLCQITAALANFAPSIDVLCVAAVLNDLPGEIGIAFWKAEKAIQADERKLRHKSLAN